MKRLSDQTLYEILEVEPDAPAGEIAAAYERARAIYGPGSLATYTLMTPDEAELLTTRIEEAGRTLLDPDARSRYDRSLTSPDAGELRAAVNAHAGGHANGTNGASGSFTLPPVIPALQPAEPSPAPERASPRTDEVPAAAVAQPPSPAAGLPPAGPDATPPAAPAPIRLDREILEAPEPPAAPPEPPPVAVQPAPPPPAPAQPAPAPPVEAPVPEGSVWTGEALRRVREARGITVAQIAERTKVTRHHVENVEADRFSALPAPVYLRGILLSLARELRLDGQKVARSYLDRVAAALKK